MKENVFEKVNQPNVAYWLGFLAADGSVSTKNRLSFCLAEKDKNQVEKFRQFLEIEKPIKYVKKTCKDKSFGAYDISVSNKRMVRDLSYYGIIPNKSHKNINFLENIPESYRLYFIFGLLDGDGSIINGNNRSIFFMGNEQIINSVCDFLYNYFKWDNKPNIKKVKRSIYVRYFCIFGLEKQKAFLEAYIRASLYCDILQRKLEKAKELLERCNTLLLQKKQKQIGLKQQLIIKTCPICKKEYSTYDRGQIYCSQKCSHMVQRVVKRPERDILKQAIRYLSFCEIGRIYSVTDNAIRKWCKAYNLPFKKTEIKKYSDEEWDLI